MNYINYIIGSNVKKYRKINGITQKKLAELLNLSITTISRLENGKTMVSLETIRSLANVLNVNIEDIIGNENYLRQNIAEDESELVKSYRMLSPENKQNILNFISIMIKNSTIKF